MRYLLTLIVSLVGIGAASACDPALVYRQFSTAYGLQQYAEPTSLVYATPNCGMSYAPAAYGMSYGYQRSYRVTAPTYIAPGYSQLGFPAQTPITIVNNNNNNGGGAGRSVLMSPGVGVGASFGVGVGVQPFSVQQNTFIGRRAFRFAR